MERDAGYLKRLMLLPEIEKPEQEDKGSKGKKRKGKSEEEEEFGDLREWKDNDDGCVSIAEMIGNSDK